MSSALIDATRENAVPLVTQLIAKGVDVYGADNYGRTALFWAAYRGFEECTKLLLEANADVNKFDLLGWNALHVASCNGYVNCVKVEGSFGSLFVLWMKKKKQSHFRCAASHQMGCLRGCQNQPPHFFLALGCQGRTLGVL